VIRLEKSAKPEVLVANEQTWNDEYVALRAAGLHDETIEGRHRHAEIKACLIAEAFDKCMYCEEKLSSAQFGDVEHIRPKALYPYLYVTWENLGLACIQCNNAKSNKEGFVNPYVEEPLDFISFAGPFIRYDAGNAKGQFTVRGLKLNRMPLIAKRTTAIEKLVEKLDLLVVIQPGPMRDVLETEIQETVSNDQEFAGTLRAFLAAA
jgi:hypothetical protein